MRAPSAKDQNYASRTLNPSQADWAYGMMLEPFYVSNQRVVSGSLIHLNC